jgi:hypothetical protein
MPSITLQIPSEIKEILSKHPEIEWKKIVTDTLWDYTKKIRLADKISSKSKLSREDIEQLDRVIKEGLLKHYKRT